MKALHQLLLMCGPQVSIRRVCSNRSHSCPGNSSQDPDATRQIAFADGRWRDRRGGPLALRLRDLFVPPGRNRT